MPRDFDMRRCPRCGSTTTWPRRGLHFEHSRWCSACNESYDPSEEFEKYAAAEEERMSMVTHRE